ncbi:hypothetical protein K1W54_04595 [Micromonospora sp. CPCC 205371]|nr:hypothetical protein [Micromonospora sp. CPCC 205371]
MCLMARHTINYGAINAMFRNPSGRLARDMLRRGLKVEAAAKRNLAGGSGKPRRIDTGQTRASVNTRLVAWRGLPAARIGSPLRKAALIHWGTGIYGPRRQPIRPKRAKYLRFKPKGSNRVIYARSVKGMKANPFLKDALPAARD